MQSIIIKKSLSEQKARLFELNTKLKLYQDKLAAFNTLVQNSKELITCESKNISKVHIGCGPKNILPNWWNIDIRFFPGIDQVVDVTKPWPFSNVKYVYGEHFLEHLHLEEAVSFFNYAWDSMKPEGVIRLSTPSLEWVLSTHTNFSNTSTSKHIEYTFAINRAFHGWGHKFLYSKELLWSMLCNLGWEKIKFCDYGISEYPALKGLECHGGYKVDHGYPSVWIVEAIKGNQRCESDIVNYQQFLQKSYVTYVQSGH